MMKRILLVVLCLSGWSVSSCLPRQYRYVDDPMTWTEAQTYCRQKYTDLATIESPEEMDQLMSSVPSDQSNSHVWIGLYSNIQWKWSDGYTGTGSDYRNWEKTKEPDNSHSTQYCVEIDDQGRWWDDGCSSRRPSICYRGTQQDPEFVLVSHLMSWSDAQKNCRENYADLATVRNNSENQEILENLVPKDSYPWIGLYRDPNMFWSDGNRFSFQFWGWGSNPLGSESVVCGTSVLSDSGKWRPKPCNHRYPFVCYGSRSKHVIKLRMKLDDPSVDLNDPTVKAGLLRQLQDRLKDRGLSGVTLKWREQPDGKVFHKEEESSQEKDKEKFEL